MRLRLGALRTPPVETWVYWYLSILMRPYTEGVSLGETPTHVGTSNAHGNFSRKNIHDSVSDDLTATTAGDPTTTLVSEAASEV